MRAAAWLGLALLGVACRAEPERGSERRNAGAPSAALGALPALHQAALVAEYKRRSDGVSDAALHATDVSVRKAAVRALARIGDASAVKRLLPALADEAPSVVRWAAFGLGHACASRAAEVQSALVLRAASLLSLAATDPALLEAGQALADALGRCGSIEAERTLRAWLALERPLAEAAALALGRVASRRGRLEEATWVSLLESASRRDEPIHTALEAFTRVTPPQGPLRERLLAVAGAALGRTAVERSFAMRSLARLGDAGVPPLATLLLDARTPALERAELARELGTGGRKAQLALAQALAALAQLSESELGARAEGAELGALLALIDGLTSREPAAHATLERLARLELSGASTPSRSRRVLVRCAAARVLAGASTIHAHLRACDPDLEGLSGKLSLVAVLGRGSLGGARGRRLGELAADADPLVRREAVRLIAAHPELEASSELLARALGDPAPGTIAAAAEVLAQHPERASGQAHAQQRAPEPAVIDALTRALRQADTCFNVGLCKALFDAAAALGVLSVKAELTRACRGDNPGLREHAERALRALGEPTLRCSQEGAPSALPHEVARPLGRPVRLLFSTDAGELALTLEPEAAPAAVTRIVDLARSGFYAGQRVHRVVPGFVTQLGCPVGDGFGGAPLPPLRSELAPESFRSGDVGMALSGPDSGSSQFFVAHARFPHLDGEVTRVGRAGPGWERLAMGDQIRHVRVVEE